MFGQTAGIGSTSISKSYNTGISEKINDTNADLRSINTQDKKIIKIVDFDKEKQSKKNNLNKKIKVKIF